MLSGQISKYGMQETANLAFRQFDRAVKSLIQTNLEIYQEFVPDNMSDAEREFAKGLLAHSEELASLMYVQLCDSAEGKALLARIAEEAGLEVRS